MTLVRRKDGGYDGLFRRAGMKALHVSMRTKKKGEAQARHDAVQKLVRQRRDAMLEQLRSGVLTVERVEAMVEHHEPLVPVVPIVAVESRDDVPAALPWDTLDAAAARYERSYASHPNRKDASKRLLPFELKRFRDFAWEGARLGDRPLDAIPWRAIEAYQQSMIDAGDPVNTVTVYMSRVPALYRWAAAEEQKEAREQGRAPRALFSPVERDRLARGKHHRDRVLTVAEADAVMARTPDRLKFTIACGLLAGLRAGETLHLRPQLDVDPVMGTIHVRKQPDWTPKTERSVRLVPMAEPLRRLAERHVKDFASAAWMHPSPVLDGVPLSHRQLARDFKAIVEGAGITYGRAHAHGVTYHTLRHTFASHAVMRGVDLYTVAKLLGDSVEMVETTYADLSPDHKRAAVVKLAQAFIISDEIAENDTSGDTENGR